MCVKGLLKKILNTNEAKFPDGVVGTLDPLKLKLGKSVSFGGQVAVMGDGEVEIGEGSAIAYGVTIHTSTHDYSYNPPWRVKVIRPVKIGNGAWIGTGAIILPGVIIGDCAVVGAGAVVTANVPDYAIVAGNPARIIKYKSKTGAEGQKDLDLIKVENQQLGYLSKDCKEL